MKKFVLCLLVFILCVSAAACGKSTDSDGASVPTPTTAAQNASAGASSNDAATGSEYRAVGTDYFGVLGETKLYNYYLTCIYRARVDAFVKKQHDYDADWSVEEYFDFTVKVLAETDPAAGKTNRELLQEQAVKECMYMAVLYREATANNIRISETTYTNLFTWWQRYANQYYSRLNGTFSYIQDADTAMEFMAGGSVNEVIDYMGIQTVIAQYTSNYFYYADVDNRDFAKYYQEHINDFRRVTVRAVYVKDQAQADAVRKLMNNKPEHIANLAKAFNEDPKLAETNGIVTVTADTRMVPEEVKEWAYRQTADVTFYEHGNIEILQTSEGYYLLMCESVEEYQENEGNEIYKAVVEAYKTEQLNAHLDELLTQEAYKLTEYDYDKAVAAMNGSLKL